MQTRREWLLASSKWMLGALTLGFLPRVARALGADVTKLLEESPLVYVSPLLAGGKESTCHSEVWYAWIDGSVVMTVATSGWKSRSIDAGHDTARLWVGDHGRWKGMISNNEAFRKAPSFDARAEKTRDELLLDRLMAAYRKKYPGEIGRWEQKMREGNEDGSRIMIRYTPIG